MSTVKCTDIFNSVLANVKRAYLAGYSQTSVRTKSVSESATEDESGSKASMETPPSSSSALTTESSSTLTETVRESVERVKESEVIAEVRRELEGKFPFALGAVCSDLATLDIQYRSAKGYEPQEEFSPFFVDVIDDFPLSDRFAHPCVMYISSMLLIDVDEARSDAFYERYIKAVTAIISELPCELHPIKQRYQ